MKLTTRGRYGTRFMLDLAIHYKDRYVVLKDLAERQDLSIKYLDQLVGSLRKSGLVKSKRGVNGGFMLAKPPEDISLIEVVEAVEGPLDLVDCVTYPEQCPKSSTCAARFLWKETADAMREALQKYTLADLVRKKDPKRRRQPRTGAS